MAAFPPAVLPAFFGRIPPSDSLSGICLSHFIIACPAYSLSLKGLIGSPGLPPIPNVQHAMLSDPGEIGSTDHLVLRYGDFHRVKGVVSHMVTFEAQSLQLALTAYCLNPLVLDLSDYSRRPKVLFPVAGLPCRSVAGLPCRCGLLSRRNTRPCLDALTPFSFVA
ncbi:MAG: hypothetical protein ABW185_09475 [Sedimenticola sp.]